MYKSVINVLLAIVFIINIHHTDITTSFYVHTIQSLHGIKLPTNE